MLIYHPIYDVNHCLFRILLVLENSQHESIELDLLRHIDFYLLFPYLINEIKPFPSELVSFKKEIKKISEPYELISNKRRTMYELEAIQTTAIHNLIAKNILDIEHFKIRSLKRTEMPLPDAISNGIINNPVVKEEWFRMLINEFPTINFLGKNGLKARSGLMEFRYDVEAV